MVAPRTKPGTPRLSEIARHVVVPSGITSTGWPAVRDKCRELGIEFDAWQDGTGRLILAKRENGLYATTVGGVVISIPRQVGKTFLIGAIVFALCLLTPGLTVIWTAHRLRTAAETFAAMQGFARRKAMKPHIAKIVLGSGDEEIQFRNGSRILFGARERGFGRGFSEVDVLVFDEGQILTENAIDDMVPATNQAENPLILFTGTPPKPTDPGEVFDAKRTRALSGQADDMVYVEFSADRNCDPLDRRQWEKANPSYPRRTPEAAMLRMSENLTEDSFTREALGIWGEANTEQVISPGEWARQVDPESRALDRLTLAIDVAPDRSVSAVALAGQRGDESWHVEVDEQRNGTGWVLGHIIDRCEKNDIRTVVIDGSSAAATFVEQLREAGVEVTVTGPRDMAEACGSFYDGAVDGWLWHIDQPQLNTALGVARKRVLNDAWAWNRKSSGADITPLVSATLALWGARTSKVKKPRTNRASFI